MMSRSCGSLSLVLTIVDGQRLVTSHKNYIMIAKQ